MANVIINDTNLTNIANAIREKNGLTDTYKPSEMADAIIAIPSGGGGGDAPTDEELTFSGICSSKFSYNGWNWFLDKYNRRIKFNNISDAQNMFANSGNLEDIGYLSIPFDSTNIQSIFNYCKKLTKLPKVSGTVDRYFNNLFNTCENISSDEINKFFENIQVDPADTNCSYFSLFSYCYKVRDLTEACEWLHNNINTYTGSSSMFMNYANWFTGCYSLDYIKNFPVLYSGTAAKTSNTCYSLITYCNRLSDFIFKTNDGVPYEVNWKGQTIELNQGVGYANYSGNITGYTDFTADTRVTDDATYQSLKDNPDWWTTDVNYSRYNHDSAVRTINSLPDTSAYLATAGGTNTIKFTGASGSKTDDGAINTLTEAEIAVAAAKGWTVSLV